MAEERCNDKGAVEEQRNYFSKIFFIMENCYCKPFMENLFCKAYQKHFP